MIATLRLPGDCGAEGVLALSGVTPARHNPPGPRTRPPSSMAPKPDEPATLPAQYMVAAHKEPSDTDWCAPWSEAQPPLAPPRAHRSFARCSGLRLWRCLGRTYQARKNANEGKGDVVFNQLQYIPVCVHMPTCKPQCEEPLFQWVRAHRQRQRAGRPTAPQ